MDRFCPVTGNKAFPTHNKFDLEEGACCSECGEVFGLSNERIDDEFTSHTVETVDELPSGKRPVVSEAKMKQLYGE